VAIKENQIGLFNTQTAGLQNGAGEFIGGTSTVLVQKPSNVHAKPGPIPLKAEFAAVLQSNAGSI